MANMTFKANLLPNTNLGYSLGSSDLKWNIYGDLNGNATTADALKPISSIGNSSTTHATALQNYFSSNFSSTPRNKLISFYDSSNSNGSIGFGYFLDGYNTNPYGGFFVSHYDTPYYVGIQGGTYTNQVILTSTNYTSYVSKLKPITVNASTLNSESGTFAYTGSGDPYAGCDWVGLQIGDSAEKWQLMYNQSNGHLSTRFNDNGGTNTSWGNWMTLLDTVNYTDYTVTKTGGGASGTWGINISGTATKANQDAGGYDINDWYGKDHIQIIDVSSLNANTWYPVITQLPIDGLHWIGVVNELNSGNKPAWASHDSGYTCCVELLVTSSGWGTTNRYTILLQNDQCFITDMAVPPVGYNQFTNDSQACFYVRGGGKYRMRISWKGTWTLLTSSATYSSQTIAPVTSYPGIAAVDIQLLDRDKYSHFIRAYGAVWNDYAEMRNAPLKPGRCVKEVGDNTMILTTQRLQRGCKIVSDTFGFNIGETENCKTPIAVSGRVLAYIYEGREEASKHIGWPVCSGPNGTVSIMTEEEEEKYPSRIVGTISEIPNYEEWGTGKVKVNGRIWIYVK